MAKPALKEHRIERQWCKGCGICVHFCPKNVLEMDEEGKAFAARPGDCICCRMCELRCPDLAVEVICETSGNNEIPDKDQGGGNA
ncbi:MAG: 4Fe-4S dicluster domain-containing protein [Thermodesulfobacteriota bacterium]